MDQMIDPVVSPDWVAAHLDEVVVVHVGTTMTGHDPVEAFAARHLPGSRYLSLDDDLAAAPAPVAGRHPLPDPAAFARALGAAGVARHDVVVGVDDRNGAFAARLVWMLRIIDQPAALLDGGLAGWNGPVESGAPDTRAASPIERPTVDWPAHAIADADDVAAHIASGGVVVDAREPARYAGEVEPIDAVAGHVPGAINLPFAENLVDGRWRPAEQLAERFRPLADDPAAIVYCGSGVTACHDALAIEQAGLPRPRVYVGSWSGWSSDPTRPVGTAAPPAN